MRLKRDAAYVTHSDIASERPECARVIGAISMAWSSLETTLTLQYVQIVHGSLPFAATAQTITLEAFDSIESWRQKKDSLLAASRHRFDESLVSAYEKILSRVGDGSLLRNRVMHGRWFVSDDYPDGVIHTRRLSDLGEAARVYDVKTLNELLASIQKKHHALEKFFHDEMLPNLKSAGDEFVRFVKSADISPRESSGE